MGLEIVHDAIDRLRGEFFGASRQMGVDGRSAGRTVPQIFLNEAQIDSAFQ